MTRPRIAITTGEPAGIGAEIAATAAADAPDADVVLVGDASMLAERARAAGVPWPARATVHHVPLAAAARPGHLDVRNAAYVLATLDHAIDGALAGRYDAIVTAPVQKSVINDGGVAFTGHTEYLAARAKAPQVVMMLAGETSHGPLRVALATTHLALADVPRALSVDGLVQVTEVLLRDLEQRFGIARPRVAVAGLNPHAGEGGHLGREEIEVIAPAIERLRRAGHAVDGPLPADTLFVPSIVQRYDAVLAMFHDQGLPVLKYATFGHGINITLGLPFIRTSVDHGTALDIAGTGRADAGSMHAALALAVQLAARRGR
ncbi:MAG: 4-hydroxythreonine-4-phosphate dehydrogenase PdxA [Betaproteobacteria bacterium]